MAMGVLLAARELSVSCPDELSDRRLRQSGLRRVHCSGPYYGAPIRLSTWRDGCASLTGDELTARGSAPRKIAIANGIEDSVIPRRSTTRCTPFCRAETGRRQRSSVQLKFPAPVMVPCTSVLSRSFVLKVFLLDNGFAVGINFFVCSLKRFKYCLLCHCSASRPSACALWHWVCQEEPYAAHLMVCCCRRLIVLVATALFAQVVITSTIVGTVSDPQRAVVPGANVTLTNWTPASRWKATTSDEPGTISFPTSGRPI